MDDLDLLNQMADPMEGRGPPPGYEDYGSTSGGNGGGYTGAGPTSAGSYRYHGGSSNIGVRVEPKMVNGRLVIEMPPPPPPDLTEPLIISVGETRDVAIQVEQDFNTAILHQQSPQADAPNTNQGTRKLISYFTITFLIVLPFSFIATKRFL